MGKQVPVGMERIICLAATDPAWGLEGQKVNYRLTATGRPRRC